jgi:hypothetical protein
MKRTALVLWAALCIVSALFDLDAIGAHPAVWYLWACLALDVATVPLCAWLYGRVGTA